MGSAEKQTNHAPFGAESTFSTGFGGKTNISRPFQCRINFFNGFRWKKQKLHALFGAESTFPSGFGGKKQNFTPLSAPNQLLQAISAEKTKFRRRINFFKRFRRKKQKFRRRVN